MPPVSAAVFCCMQEQIQKQVEEARQYISTYGTWLIMYLQPAAGFCINDEEKPMQQC